MHYRTVPTSFALVALALLSVALALPGFAQPGDTIASIEPETFAPTSPEPPCCDDDAPPPAPVVRSYSRADRLLAAQACVHEATWAGGERTFDCGGIIQVVEERRRERDTFSEALARTMPRFYSGRTTRAWTRSLIAGVMHRDPPGWPFGVAAVHYDDEWRAVYARVSAFMSGAEALPCSPSPSRWFGRRTDHEALERTLADGEWREATCGPTANAFLFAVDPE